MRRALERIEEASRGRGPLHRLDPRLKILATVAFAVLAVLIPVGRWRLLLAGALVLAFLIGLSGLRPGPLVRRWLALLPVVAFLAAMIAPGHPASAEHGPWAVGLTIVGRNGLAMLAVLLLGHVTPLPALIGGLGRLGAPTVVLSTLQIMARYLYVLSDEFDRMALARRARTFRRSPLDTWRGGASLIASLFLRSFERGERVHSAMLARGWDGTPRSLDDPGRP
jgi:cobalt/nickel transport system permease protein